MLGVEGACHAEVRGAFARAGAAALDADLPDDGCEQEDRAGLILAVGVALRTPALGNGGGLGLGDLACQLGDAVGRHTGDLRGPLRSLLDAVGSLAHDVGAVGGVLRRRVGQGVLVQANGVLVEELLVLEVLRQHDVDEPGDERGVGAGAQVRPFVGERDGGFGLPRVDNDGLDPVLLLDLLGHEGFPAAPHAGFQRVIAEHDLELGVRDVIEGVRTDPLPVVVRVGRGDLGRGVVRVVVEVAASQVHQARERGLDGRPGTRDRRPDDAGAVLQVEGLVAVGGLVLLHLLGDLVEGLFPGDLDPLAVSPLSAWLALQWGLQAVRVVDAVPDRPAADAGSDLLGAQFRVTGVIGHDLNDLAVPHLEAQRAAGTAVHSAGGPDDLLVSLFLPIAGMPRNCLLRASPAPETTRAPAPPAAADQPRKRRRVTLLRVAN